MSETVRDTGSGGRYGEPIPPSFSSARFARYQASGDDYVDEFKRLLRKWRHETLTASSSDEIVSRPEFHRIVALGRKAVPLIIEEIRVRPDHLIAALSLITGENPVPDYARGDFFEMADAWVRWYERER